MEFSKHNWATIITSVLYWVHQSFDHPLPRRDDRALGAGREAFTFLAEVNEETYLTSWISSGM